MKLQILGKGCPKCKKLEQHARQAADGLDVEIEKVYNLKEASAMGMMTAPGLAIDGELKIQGRVPETSEIRELIEQQG